MILRFPTIDDARMAALYLDDRGYTVKLDVAHITCDPPLDESDLKVVRSTWGCYTDPHTAADDRANNLGER